MSTASLQLFCNRVAATGTLSRTDLRELTTEILPEGLTCRDEVDLLLALDRTVTSETAFTEFLVSHVVDYVVWTERPTGLVDGELGIWISTSIAGRTGPTPTGSRIAREIIREADSTDEALIAFALEANGWTSRAAGTSPIVLAKAA